MPTKSDVGKIGEEYAMKWLQSQGYKTIERNYRQPWGEIDLIVKSCEGVLVFVEVKTFMKDERGTGLTPEENLTAAKIKKFKKIAAFYAAKNSQLIREDRGWRLDALAIELPSNFFGKSSNRDIAVRHYENI